MKNPVIRHGLPPPTPADNVGQPPPNRPAVFSAFLVLGVVAFAAAAPAAAESPQEFAKRIEQPKAVQPVVNQRNDGSFGSISIGIQPATVQDRAKLDPLLGEIAKFAAESKLKADVLTPSRADADHIAQRLKEGGVSPVNTRVMADTVSIKTTRIFLTPERPEPVKPPAEGKKAAPQPPAEPGKPAQQTR